MKVWWLGNAHGRGNFGDILTPTILDYFNIKYEYVRHYFDAEAVCVGSIARRAGSNVTVLGSGIISESDRLIADADWKFVRGPYTKKRVEFFGGTCPAIYGDPALLLPLIINPSDKENNIGIVAHNVDIHWALEKYKDQNVIGLGTRDCRTVIDKITKCNKIISSSLHGIICAHAYGIPAAWVKPNKKLKGDNIKFKDYFASVGIEDYKISSYDSPVYIDPPKKLNLDPIIEIFEGLEKL